LHLGTRACKANTLLDFLCSHHTESLYLVGDIIDGWNLGCSWYWSSAQAAVVEEIARWRRQGVRVVFLPGNHDEPHSALVREIFGPIPMVSELVHRTAEGCRMLVIHGHQFDSSLSSARWLSLMGSQAYTFALRIDQWHRRERFKIWSAGIRFVSQASGYTGSSIFHRNRDR
jgi:UDP-2,3-diacylglucosamine pyrophosphatase LpxH